MAEWAAQVGSMQTVCTLRESPLIRQLEAGDEDVVARLASRTPRTRLLSDERTILLVAFEGDAPIGFVLAYELPRRHGLESMLLIYEVEVDAAQRRRGVATRLLRELEELARLRGIGEGFVLTEPDNDPANALYRSLGGERTEVVQWDFPYADD
jgi:ribosomal protein S18 acetylase RimI-like enzyme